MNLPPESTAFTALFRRFPEQSRTSAENRFPAAVPGGHRTERIVLAIITGCLLLSAAMEVTGTFPLPEPVRIAAAVPLAFLGIHGLMFLLLLIHPSRHPSAATVRTWTLLGVLTLYAFWRAEAGGFCGAVCLAWLGLILANLIAAGLEATGLRHPGSRHHRREDPPP